MYYIVLLRYGKREEVLLSGGDGRGEVLHVAGWKEERGLLLYWTATSGIVLQALCCMSVASESL